jgi:predicted nucleic acid-binding protein
MPGNVFLDTNILVYAIETDGPNTMKSSTAVNLSKREDVSISAQVLGEFYRAVTSPRREVPLTHNEALVWVQFWKRYDVWPITIPHVDLALEVAKRFQIGYFDALIVAAARLADCGIIYSEDLNDGQDYGGVRVENPFRN